MSLELQKIYSLIEIKMKKPLSNILETTLLFLFTVETFVFVFIHTLISYCLY